MFRMEHDTRIAFEKKTVQIVDFFAFYPCCEVSFIDCLWRNRIPFFLVWHHRQDLHILFTENEATDG